MNYLFSAQIAAFTAELDEQTEKLEQLRKGVEEHQTQKHEISLALAAARRECEQRKGFTKSEAFGFERELNILTTSTFLQVVDIFFIGRLQRNSKRCRTSTRGDWTS
jgi:cell division septum initiation protein DivIVA